MREITGLLFSTVGPLVLVAILWGILAISKRKPPNLSGSRIDYDNWR